MFTSTLLFSCPYEGEYDDDNDYDDDSQFIIINPITSQRPARIMSVPLPP